MGLKKEEWIKYQVEELHGSEEVIKFIASIVSVSDSLQEFFSDRYQYAFANILKDAFGRGEICWRRNEMKIVWKDITNTCYSADGVYTTYESDNDIVSADHLGQLIRFFTHDAREFEVYDEVFTKWCKDLDMEPVYAITDIYLKIDEEYVNFEEDVIENALKYWSSHIDELQKEYSENDE